MRSCVFDGEGVVYEWFGGGMFLGCLCVSWLVQVMFLQLQGQVEVYCEQCGESCVGLDCVVGICCCEVFFVVVIVVICCSCDGEVVLSQFDILGIGCDQCVCVGWS